MAPKWKTIDKYEHFLPVDRFLYKNWKIHRNKLPIQKRLPFSFADGIQRK